MVCIIKITLLSRNQRLLFSLQHLTYDVMTFSKYYAGGKSKTYRGNSRAVVSLMTITPCVKSEDTL
jgi:hypothetical protein